MTDKLKGALLSLEVSEKLKIAVDALAFWPLEKIAFKI